MKLHPREFYLMPSVCLRFLLLGSVLIATARVASAQIPTPSKTLARNVEPGLEHAVHWKWQAQPSTGESWGEGLPEPTPTPTPSAFSLGSPTAPALSTGNTYEVQHGDRLILIAKRYGITVAQLKGFNSLTTDMIRVGQVLNIPTLEQARAIAPVPEPAKPKAARGKAAPVEKTPLENANDTIVLQIFLDREGFSPGPIDGMQSIALAKITELYLSAHPEIPDAAALQQTAQAAVGDAFIQYALKPEDFQFISPPKAQRSTATAAEAATSAKSKTKLSAATGVSFQDLIAEPMLAYRTPWEFVAERFHCEEAFLRSINPQIHTVPQIGAVFRVPKVNPFEIENAFVPTLQATPDPQKPVTAMIEDVTYLEIFQAGHLVSAMPISAARPGLHGRGTWTILNAIARPRLATQMEPTATATPPPQLFGSTLPAPKAAPTPLPPPEYLPSGPNNPAGIVWINLAKAGSAEPLPYGLHGTSIPDQVKLMDSIGGFRVANWNILLAAHLLPIGTPLEWKQTALTAPAPAAQSAAPSASPAQL